MVKSYMRHGPTQAFGIICSPTANSSFDGRLAYVPAWEDVLVWDVKTGEMISMWHSPSHTASVTSILPAPVPSTSTSSTSRTFSVSYNDGSIRLWSFSPSDPSAVNELVTFNGHKKSVTCTSWDADGARLASGGTEGEIVIWDRVAEVGLFRLKGHRAPVTGLHFIPHPTLGVGSHPGYLISTSRDTYLKLWDLGTQHCIQTVVIGRGEVLSCAIREEDHEVEGGEEGEELSEGGARGRWIIVTGSGDGEAKVWSMEKKGLEEGLKENANGELPKLIEPLTSLPLPPSTTPITQIAFHSQLPLILLQTSDRSVVALRLRSNEEVQAKQARRKKREKEKKDKKKGAAVDIDLEGETVGAESSNGVVKWEERIAVLCTVRANAKIRSFALSDTDSGLGKNGIPLLLSLNNNALETYLLPPPIPKSKSKSIAATTGDVPTEPTKTHSVEIPGHRQDVRCIAISADDQVIASASSGTLKIWNRSSMAVIRTMECGYVVCLAFLPGDRHVVVGTKSGELVLYDIVTSSQLSTYKAHNGAVWSVHVRPDGRGLVSGSADKDVKFWDFEMKEVESEGDRVVDRLGRETVFKTKQLTLVHTRTLKMTDDVLCVKYSPDGRLLAVALLDSTVKIFFQDTLKFFLSLYGHKLPVLSLDISHDSKLIITSSADKNIKIWGLDFGDCHRSIFAHDESVMQVAFEKGSHMFWSVGKDRSVKYWDGDKFELVQKLDGHHGEIWALATSHQSDFIVTGSHDKSIRIWEKTDEPLFLDEERERELEALYDNNIASDANRTNPSDPTAEEVDGDEVEAVQKTTTETLMAGEKIVEAIELADAERETVRQWEEDKSKLPVEQAEHLPKPPRHPELVARGDMEPDDYVLKVMKSVPAAQMEDALLVLPFGIVCSLLVYLDGWARADRETVLTTRTLSFILRTSSNQIIANRILRTQLLELRTHLRDSLTRQRDMIGFNLAALKFVKGRYEDGKLAGVLDEQDEEKIREKMGRGRGKRKRVVIG